MKFLETLAHYHSIQFTIYNDHLTIDQMREREDLQCLKILAEEKGRDCQLKGDQIIDNWGDDKSNLESLPEDISMERAKTQMCNGVKGLAFQGHHSPLSNFYPCKIQFKNQTYVSVEQAYFHQAAIGCNMLTQANVIKATQSPYEIKALSKKIPTTPLWAKE